MTCLSALPYLPTSINCLHCYYIQFEISCKGDKLVAFAMFVSKYDGVLY